MHTLKDNIQKINIHDYSYELPEDRIARYPLEERDSSKLLVFTKEQVIAEAVFRNIDDYIPAGALLVFNNTKVIHARLLFKRATGASIEIFCMEPVSGDYQQVFAMQGGCSWNCMVGNAKRWKEPFLEKEVQTPNGLVVLRATQKGRSGELFEVQFSWNAPELSFAEILHYAGILPLPPYLNRETEQADEERYQTIYASVQGSVAAPTAGLHFTQSVFERLEKKSIKRVEVTLHVGAGTFKPVKTDALEGHEMHEEMVVVTKETIMQLVDCLRKDGPVVAVGTTSVRTLESLYWHGVNVLAGRSAAGQLHINQWAPYENNERVDTVDALQAIVDGLEKAGTHFVSGPTRIILAPGYRFHLVKGLVTNFHQPENTLILLIAAFVGNNWRDIYNYALNNRFRFLSYGDSSLLWTRFTAAE